MEENAKSNNGDERQDGKQKNGRRKQQYQTADCAYYGLLKEFAHENRRNPTKEESILWAFLQHRQLGVRFRRQHIIGLFIVDFCCLSVKLVIEVDGGYHQLPGQQFSDEERAAWLQSQGFTVIRFTNDQILSDPDAVARAIQKEVEVLQNARGEDS